MRGTYDILIYDMTKKKRKFSRKKKRAKVRAVCIDSNAPFDMLFKYEMNVPWQCVSIGSEMREVSKNLKEDKKEK